MLFEVLLAGVGTAQLSGFVDESQGAIINQTQYTFSGTATSNGTIVPGEPIPEPASVLLTGGGAALLGLIYRRRRATQA